MENLNTFIKSSLLKNSTKLKFKYPPISEKVDNQQKIMKIKNIFQLKEQAKDLLLIKLKNYNKRPNFRYFLAIILANQSSDLLVILAKNDENYKKEYKLIQYPIYPQFHRIALLCLIELVQSNQFSVYLQALNEFKYFFRKKIDNLIKSN